MATAGIAVLTACGGIVSTDGGTTGGGAGGGAAGGGGGGGGFGGGYTGNLLLCSGQVNEYCCAQSYPPPGCDALDAGQPDAGADDAGTNDAGTNDGGNP